MQQIADWLEKLGMSEYAQRFTENDIDFTILGDLSDQDLEKIGVASLGHRRKLLRAIADLKVVEKNGPVASVAAAPPAAPQPVDTAERRQVTVMFSDLVGSTALSARMDPEDLREVISAYQKCVAGTVQRFGGFVAKYMGDGVLVYFGYPQAHEDDVERAVRAGLELIQAVGGLKSSAPLQTRVGIATGLVVVGDLIGSGAAQEQAIVGETPNIAARLQGIAEPNTVVVAETTRKLLGNLFDLQDLGAQDLKGISGPVRAWAALRQASVESRFEALHVGGLTELVGREEELELLLRRWSKAKGGEGQVVLLSGEAGIGKSRLTAALLEKLTCEPHTRLRYFCSPQHTDSAFFPIIGQMERAAGLTHEDTSQVRLDKFDALLAQTSTSRQDAALIAEMLSLSNDGRYSALELTPEQRRQKTMEALIAQVQALRHQKPVLMIFEDAHWTDPTSLEVFGWVVDRIATLRVLLIVTFRPEFEPPWIGRPHLTALTLNRLTRREIDAMIDRVVGNKAIPVGIRQDIVERTDGIPLFIEEMTKAVFEAGSEDAAPAAAIPSPALAVPASLQASLMARLDRLGSAKEIAQIGAALGREFSHAQLAAVARKSEVELRSALERLATAGLLFQRGAPPYFDYTFKHALVQDAAYGTLLRERRRALHAHIAATLESQFTEIGENQPELLARHCTEAGLIEKAIGLWGRAGQRSLRRSSFNEATQQFKTGLTLLHRLPKDVEGAKAEIELQTGLGVALTATRGSAAFETGQAYARARLLCEKIGDTTTLVRVGYGQYLYHLMTGEVHQSLQLATETLGLAEKINDDEARVLGHRTLGVSLFELGRLADARGELELAASLVGARKKRGHGASSSETRIMIRSWLAVLLTFQGHLADAFRTREIALAEANASSAPHTLAFAMAFGCAVSLIMRDYQDLLTRAQALYALADEQNYRFYKNVGLMCLGYARMRLGDSHARAVFREGLSDYRNSGARWGLPAWLGAFVHALPDNDDERTTVLDQAFDAVEATQECWYQAELYRLRGDVARFGQSANNEFAEENYKTGKRIAEEQGSMLLNLRATTSLAALWRDQGKRDEARDLLAPVYGWFTEGFDTLDLKDAKALLDELAV